MKQSLRRLWRKHRRRSSPPRHNHQGRRFEALEPRLLLHNGPFDSDPAYDPNSNFHIHADLSIYVDSELITIPGNVGQGIHTHDDTGQIHIHPGPQSDFVTLSDFFDSWRDFPQPGSPSDISLSDTQIFGNTVDATHTLQMYVNGERVADEFGDYQVHDEDDIVLIYGDNPVITIDTNLDEILPDTVGGEPVRGKLPIELRVDAAPGTVENFFNYINDGDYANSIFHRLVPDFVLQGGGFTTPSTTFTTASQFSNVPTDPPIQNEFQLSNTERTIAMAKLGNDPNSATSQWFFNLSDNSANLDNQNGGFTVFAQLLDPSLIFSITELNRVNAGGAFSDLPVGQNSQLLVIESIEGEGIVRGTKFGDVNGNGVRDAGENGLQGFTIYSDANANGQLDADEVSTVSGADGTYQLRLPGGQTHRIREVPVNGVAQTLPSGPDFYTVDLEIGEEEVGRDFGNLTVPAPTAIDLLDESDSGGSDTDNLTNFNNSAVERAPRFQITGVEDGARVRVRADGVIVADEVASGTELTVTLDGVTTLADGNILIGATQEINGVEGPEANLTIDIDTSIPVFSGTPPTQATVGEAFGFNAETNEEGQSGFFYGLNDRSTGNAVDPAIGIVINPLSGTVAWNPGVEDIGDFEFNIVATDAAGNIAVQEMNVNVSRENIVRIRLQVTDLSDNVITGADIGDRFKLQVLVQDLRADAGGIFSAYSDITFDPDLVSATLFTHGPNYGQGGVPNTQLDPPETIADVNGTPGLLDEVGSFSSSLAPLGPSERLLYEVEFEALAGGTVEFAADPADLGSIHEVGLYNINGPIGVDQIDFGMTSLDISANFIVLNPTIGPDEDSLPTTLPVQSLAEFRPGFSGTLTVIDVSDPPNGIVALASNGLSFSYRPDPDYNGPDEVTYTVSDGSSTAKGTVAVAVQPVNDPPTAVDDSFEDPINGSSFVIPEDNPNNFLPVLANDLSDPDDPSTETLSVDTVQATSNQGGTVIRSSSGLGILYTPAANFQGQDTFTYNINDGKGGVSQNATVTVNVVELNDPPTALDDNFPGPGETILEDSMNVILDVLANDSTAPDDDEVLSITGVSNPTSGGVVTVIDNSTRLQYTPLANFFGTDTFTYTITDGNGGTDQANVTVTVTGVNDPPTATDDSGAGFRVTQNTMANVLDVLANDTIAPDTNEELTITGVSGVTAGATVNVANDGKSILYTPVANFLGDDTFTYTISDGSGEVDTATVTVNVVEFIPASLSGFVYIDSNNNGVKDTNERGLDGVTVALTGTDLFGQVNTTAVTANGGQYSFNGLAPGTYVITETQPDQNFEGDNIPIIDGIDTVGSQGGTLSGNDAISVTLAEGVDGIDNNFGELKGRSLGGSLRLNDRVRFGGLNVNLSRPSTNELLFQRTSGADGFYAFDGLVPAEYNVAVTSPTFLFNQADALTVTVADADSLENNFELTGRQAANLTYRDFLAARSMEAIHAAVQPGAAAQEWFALDTGWDGVEDVVVQLADGNASLNLRITENSGTLMEGTLPLPDPEGRVRILAQHTDGTALVRLDGNRSAYDDVLQDVTANGNTEGEGEVGTTGFAATSVPASVTLSHAPIRSEVAPTTSLTPLPEVSHSPGTSSVIVGATEENSPTLATVVSHAVSSTLQSLSPASGTQIEAVDAVFTDATPVMAEDHAEGETHHHDSHGDHDDESLMGAVDLAFADDELLETLP